MSTPVRFAVIVGVDDYRAFDASLGKPAGTSDLRGSVNDAGLYLRLARKLGVPDANIRVLVAPASGAARPALFDGIEGSAPTQTNMQAAFDWLIDSLKANPGTQAILTYSGHGDSDDENLVICPTDMTADKDGTLHNQIQLGGLDSTLKTVADSNLITIFLDCCHAGDADDGNGNTVRTLRPGARTAIQTRQLSDGHPVLAACRASALSSEINFGDTHFGAFSWAVTEVLGRWQEKSDGGAASYGIAYGDVPARTSMLMNAMAIEQMPVYEGAAIQSGACVFTRADHHTEPPQPDGHRELFPGDNGIFRIYYLYDKDGNHVISALVTGEKYTGTGGYAANTEYWTQTSSAVSKLQSTSQIQFQNKYTATSTTANPASHGYASLGGKDYSMSTQTFSATSPSDSFSFNKLFERENATTGIGFIWDGNLIKAIQWFHHSSGLLFSSSGSLNNSTFNSVSDYALYQAF